MLVRQEIREHKHWRENIRDTEDDDYENDLDWAVPKEIAND